MGVGMEGEDEDRMAVEAPGMEERVELLPGNSPYITGRTELPMLEPPALP